MILAIILSMVLPLNEQTMIHRVEREYCLNDDETTLLCAIRIHENGRPGLEFGVAQNQPYHPARRYTDGYNSFLTQARWAAGTIKRRYHGNLESFSKRYCAADYISWEKDVRKIMKSINNKY